MRTPQPLWAIIVLIGVTILGGSSGWSGAPWDASVTSEDARSSIKFAVGLAIVVVGAYLRYRASRRGHVDTTPPAA